MLTLFTLKVPDVLQSVRSEFDPCMLDREADVLLQMGYRHQAERLAHEAAELREART